MLKTSLSFIFLSFLLMSCSSKTIDYKTLSSFDKENNLRAVIEIPTGTNDKIEYKPKRNAFEMDTLNGKVRVIKFLPYPVNYGFIPSTVMAKDLGGDGDPLDILVFGKPLKTGQVISVSPIALLKMTDEGEQDNKILSIPVNVNDQIIPIKNFDDLSQNYPEIRNMIAEWFQNYDKSSDIEILGWFDESLALKEVELWQKRQ